MQWVEEKYDFRSLAYVILPDHLHWLMCSDSAANCSRIVSAFKRDVIWRMKEASSDAAVSPLWQKRFYDHVIRDANDLGRHLDYIHFNPVKHGYVNRPADYPHSSFSEWVRYGVYEPGWGLSAPETQKGMDLE